MSLSRDEVAHIAALAQLELDEEALQRYREQLSQILDYAARLQALDTDAIPPTATVLPLRTILRADEVGETLPIDEVLLNAPQALDRCFVVPPINALKEGVEPEGGA